MFARHHTTAILALALTVMVCGEACANSIAPYAYFFPGIIWVSLIFAFPASLLAAFVERPFLTRAGILQRPLVLSLRANFISTIVGLLLVPIGMPAMYFAGPLWCLLAVVISCEVEVRYLQRFSRQRFRRSMVVVGNIVSSFVLMIIPPVADTIVQGHRRCAFYVQEFEARLVVGSIGVSVAVFLASFLWQVRANLETIASEAALQSQQDHGLAPETRP